MIKELNVRVEGDQKELVVLVGKALDPQPPVHLNIEGAFDTVSRFLASRKNQIDQKKCHIYFMRSDKKIMLVMDECDPLTRGIVSGELRISPDFTDFKINTGIPWTHYDLAEFVKMNRYAFDSKEVAMNLVKTLRDFKAEISKKIEAMSDERANYNQKREQVVNSNQPDKFTLNLQIIKGLPRVPITVEVAIHPESLNCILVSPEARDYVREVMDKAFDEEAKKIMEVTPEIVIVEC